MNEAATAQGLGQIAPFLARPGINYAPSEPILRLRDGEPKRATKLETAVKERFKHYRDLHKSAREELISAGQLVSLMCRGEHMLEKRRYGVGWYVRPINETEGYKKMVMNFMGFYRHACAVKILSVNPTVNIVAADDDPRSIAAAQEAKLAIDYWEEKFYTQRFVWREALDILNNGTRLHRVRWNPYLPGPTQRKRQVEEQEHTQPGYGRCLDCPFESDQVEQFSNPEQSYGGQCPECGSNAVEVTAPKTSILHKITAGEPVSSGGPEITRLALGACWWDLAQDAEKSSWFIYGQKIKLGDLKLIIGDAILPDTAGSDNKYLEMLERMAWGGQPLDGRGTSQMRSIDKSPTLWEFWMSPEDYADIQIEETKTVSGHTLPAGRMSDMFSGPVCFVGPNDMSAIFGIYGETHQDQIVSVQWLLDADSGAGRGIQDLVGTQNRFSASDGHIYQGLAQHATPGVMIDKRLLKDDQGEYLFRPGHVTELNLTQLPAGMDDIRKAIYVAQPGQVNSQYIQYTQEFLKSVMQVQSFAIEFSDTFMNIDPRTATGSSLISSLASSLFGPMAGVKADSRVSIAEKVAMLLAKHDRVGRYYPGKDGLKGKWVGSADLGGKLSFQLEAGSQNPSSPDIQQRNWSSMVNSVGGAEGLMALKQGEPGMFRGVSKLFGVKVESEDPDSISTRCLGRLDQMRQMVESGIDDPNVMVDRLKPPVSLIEPKHKDKREWWSSWMDSDEGQESPMPLRLAAEAMYHLHENLDTQRQMPQAVNQGLIAGAAQASAAAPAALGAKALEGQPSAEPDPQQEQEAEHAHEAALETMKQDRATKLKEMEINAESERTQVDLTKTVMQHKHETESQKRELASQEKTAKLNAKAKAQSKPKTKGS